MSKSRRPSAPGQNPDHGRAHRVAHRSRSGESVQGHSIAAQPGSGCHYISHRLEEISAIADRITVLRDGESIATRLVNEVDQCALIEMMVGREISAVYPKREVSKTDIVIELRKVHNRGAGLREISLSVRAVKSSISRSGRLRPNRIRRNVVWADTRRLGRNSHQRRPVQITVPAHAIQLGLDMYRRTAPAWCNSRHADRRQCESRELG